MILKTVYLSATVDLMRAILARDMDAAMTTKTAVENVQHELRASGARHATCFLELRDDHLRLVPIHHPTDTTHASEVMAAVQACGPSEGN